MSPELLWELDDQPALPPAPPRRPRRPDAGGRGARAALLLGCVIVLLVGAGLVARARALEERQRAAVLQAARFEDALGAAGDREALAALEDTADPGWTAWQLQPGAQEPPPVAGAMAPSRPGLHWGYTAANTYTPTTRLYTQPALDGPGATLAVETGYRGAHATSFTLRETRYYRLVGGDWHRTGPPAALAARTRELRTLLLTVRYPQADAATVEALAPRLAVLARRACADLGCPTPGMVLVFSARPSELLDPPDPAAIYLPAPALLGTPADAGAAEALYRTYAIRLAAALAARSGLPWTGLHWELDRLQVEEPIDPAALRYTARAALVGDTDILRHPAYWPAGTWLALDSLAARQAGAPLAGWRASGLALSDYLTRETARESLAWHRSLEKAADFAATRAGAAELAVLCGDELAHWQAATGLLTPLAPAGELLAWSPDGRYLAGRFDAEMGGFTVFDMGTGSAWNAGRYFAGWAPDGAHVLAPVAGPDEAWLYRYAIDPAGGMSAGEPFAPFWGEVSWAPDRRHVALTPWFGGADSGVYVATPGSLDYRRVGAGRQAAWSADGRYLATSDLGATARGVSVYDLDAGTVITLTGVPRAVALVWSPAAPVLAVADFERDPATNRGSVQLYDAAGRQLARWQAPLLPEQLAWSPDGRELAWVFRDPRDTGAGEVRLAGVAGGAARAIAVLHRVAPGDPVALAWSPGGEWLAWRDAGADGVAIWSRAGNAVLARLAGCRQPLWRPGR